MEDRTTERMRALSAHVEGLRAALGALPTDAETAASIRRIARSLKATADGTGTGQVATAARAVQNADDEVLEQAARDLLRELEALEGCAEPDGIRVLLVEDNRTMAVALQAYLKGPGHTVHHAETAAAAERLLVEHPFDIVLLDLILPDRDGRDLLIQMREDRTTTDIPVIVLSAKEGAVPKAECLAVGAREFLEKPVEPAELRAAVARHARRPTRAASAAATSPPLSLLSRADLVEAYEPLRAEAERGSPAAVALLALNDFDAVVAVLGDDASEGLLPALAVPLGAGLEGRDFLGRWGRSELLMLLPATTSTDATRKLKAGMARLAAAGTMDAYVENGAPLSFSAGVAVADAGQDLRDVVSMAEQSLLRARAGGRGVMVTAEEGASEHPPRVMIVEDDRVTATLVHHRLQREGFEVVDFLNGEDAYRWAVDSTFDLAILDVKVPGMDGFELLERLRKIERLGSVPIVMLTGLGGEADVIRGLQLGANDYMLKPFSPGELIARVRRLVYANAPGVPDEGGPTGARAEVGAR